MSDSDCEVRLRATRRNDHCPCGSGKKYKKCHLAEDQGTRTAALKAMEEEAKAKAKASKDTEGEVDTRGADQSTRSTKRRKNQPGLKGRASDARPKNIPRRGAV
jgi:hypothetical protein